MRLPLLVLTAALILALIRWLVPDGPAVVSSAPSSTEQALERGDAVVLVRSDVLEEVVSHAAGRLPVTDEPSVSAKLAASLELRHAGDGPAAFFRRWTDLRQKRSLGVHEEGLKRFRAGEGVQHLGQWTGPDDELASYWIDDQKKLLRVAIPEEGNGRLYRLHREVQWFERQVDSFRWNPAQMRELSKTVFDPVGEGSDVRREYLNALRARKGPKPEIIDGPFGKEIQPVTPSSAYENRVRAARDAYMAARAEVMDGSASGSQD